MQNRCCVNVCFFNNNSNAHAHLLLTKMILRNFIHCGQLLFTRKAHCSLKFHFGQINQSEFHFAWTHVNVNNEVTLHRSEILPPGEISNRFEFSLGLM